MGEGLQALFRACLAAHSDELRVADLQMAAFVSVTAIEALAHTAVINSPKALTDDTVRTLIGETMRLVMGSQR